MTLWRVLTTALAAILLVGFAFLFAGCEAKVQVESKPAKTPTQEEIISSAISSTVTKGNHSFIRIQLNGNPADHAELLLEVVQRFESKHPELKVTSFDIEKRLNIYIGHLTDYVIFGLWLHHHPRPSEYKVEK